MSVRYLAISSVSGASWSNPGRAVPGDSDLYADSQSGNGYITFSFQSPMIPADEDVEGVSVILRAALDVPPNTVFFLPGILGTLEASISADGATWSDRKRTPTMVPQSNVWTGYELGGEADDWGLSLPVSSFNSTAFRLRVRRPTDANEDQDYQRLLESATVAVYTTVEGSSYMPREQVHERCLIGQETAPGTPVAATILLQGATIKIDPRFEGKQHEFQGQKFMGKSSLVAEWTEGEVGGDPCYNELGYLLASVLGKPVTQQLATGVYRHQFNVANMSKDDIRTYTVECGQPSIATKAAMAIISALSIDCDRKSISMQGSLFAQKADAASAMSTQANEVQALTITGAPTAINLRFNGKETGDITISGGASAFQTALTGLTTVGSGNLAASGSGPYTFTFQSALAGMPQPRIEVVSITGGTDPTASIVRTTKGGPTRNPFVPILPAGGTVHIATTVEGLTAGKLTDSFKTTWSVGDRYAMKWVLDDALPSFKAHAETKPEFVSDITLEANSTGVGELAKWRAGTSQFMEFRWTGPEIGSSINHQLKIVQSVEVVGYDPLDETDGVVVAKVMYKPRMDASWGQAMQVVLVNSIASY